MLTLIVSDLSSQINRKTDRNTFSLGILLGANATQMDGDFFVGFDKIGFTGGIKAYTYLTPRSSLIVEILYTQKGANIPHGQFLLSTSKNDRNIDLNYVEIPILFKFLIQPELYKAYFELGPVVSRLYNYKISENEPSSIDGTVYNDLTDDFNSLEYGVISGLGFDYGKVDVGVRFNFALSKLYTSPTEVKINPITNLPRQVEFLRNYHWGVVLSYKIF